MEKHRPKVVLLACTPDPERVVAASARLCYSCVPASEIMEGLDREGAERFLDRLMNLGHASPVEHAVFTFGIDGVSRALTHQLVRHRLASYSQKSQRYVGEEGFGYVTPPAVAENPMAESLFRDAMEHAGEAYRRIARILTDGYCRDGMDPASASKKAFEDARFVLPNACETMIVVTMNARELLHFFSVRCCSRAQWEIRELAKEMLQKALAAAPKLFEKAGPPCLFGPCPEGAMSCGKADEVREEFRKLRAEAAYET